MHTCDVHFFLHRGNQFFYKHVCMKMCALESVFAHKCVCLGIF
jgi:hypothetical protein